MKLILGHATGKNLFHGYVLSRQVLKIGTRKKIKIEKISSCFFEKSGLGLMP